MRARAENKEIESLKLKLNEALDLNQELKAEIIYQQSELNITVKRLRAEIEQVKAQGVSNLEDFKASIDKIPGGWATSDIQKLKDEHVAEKQEIYRKHDDADGKLASYKLRCNALEYQLAETKAANVALNALLDRQFKYTVDLLLFTRVSDMDRTERK